MRQPHRQGLKTDLAAPGGSREFASLPPSSIPAIGHRSPQLNRSHTAPCGFFSHQGHSGCSSSFDFDRHEREGEEGAHGATYPPSAHLQGRPGPGQHELQPWDNL